MESCKLESGHCKRFLPRIRTIILPQDSRYPVHRSASLVVGLTAFSPAQTPIMRRLRAVSSQMAIKRSQLVANCRSALESRQFALPRPFFEIRKIYAFSLSLLKRNIDLICLTMRILIFWSVLYARCIGFLGFIIPLLFKDGDLVFTELANALATIS